MPPFRRTHKPPAESGARLIDPPIEPADGSSAGSIEDLVDNNRLLRAAFDTRIGDLRLWELVAATRREVLTVAAEYTSSYRDVERPDDTADWIARSSIGVPAGTPREAHLVDVPFDAASREVAWEERTIIDPDLFASFGDRACERLRPLEPDAILRRWWPLAVERAGECHRLGLAMAQARHALEARFGLETLELPVSELVRLPTVMVFMGWLLAQSRRLHEAYNAALADYRRSRRVRGRGRPMPDLAVRTVDPAEGPWFEVPWWLWSRDDPRRRRVFANMGTPGTLTLSDMETLRVELPISLDTAPSKWVDALSRMEEHAVRLRPRAIITTMVARLLVSDVFVHGIGGAAYDQLTDDIVRRLTGCDPPRYAVVSGTLRLPFDRLFPDDSGRDAAAELAEVHRLLRIL